MACCIHTYPPAVYSGYTLSDYGELGEQLEQVVVNPSVAIQKRRGFLLYGPSGSFKSSIAAAFHQALAAKQLMVRWFECAMLPPAPVEADELLEELMFENSYVVVFDDLGKEPEHHRKRVAKVIQYRALMARRFDLITTNLNVDPDEPEGCEVAEVYGEHIRSRIWGMCKRNVIEVNGADARTCI